MAAKVWKDGEAGGTPITAAELNRIEETLEAKAAQGEQGPQGEPGPQGDIGPEGPAGPKGDIGPAGADGAVGPQGERGADGDSAYVVWIAAGNTGTEADFLASLKGDPGADGTTPDMANYVTQADFDALATRVAELESAATDPTP